jgi:hypothetical protein
MALVAVSLLTGIFIGQYGGRSEAEASVLTRAPENEILETRNRGDFKFINPLLECDARTPTLLSPIRRLEEEVRSYIDNVLSDERIEQESHPAVLQLTVPA